MFLSNLWEKLCSQTLWNPVRETTEAALSAAGAYWTAEIKKKEKKERTQQFQELTHSVIMAREFI